MADTIFALSSGRPPAGIAVVRISGPGAGEALRALGGVTDTPRRARLTTLTDPATGIALDRALTLWFPGPGSATGEDMAELHCHGGRAVVTAVLDALGRMPDLVPAEPGQFTRRALENGRIDLSEAEGLADLLAAETETQRRAALAMAEGDFSRKIMKWQENILKLSAMAEAALDFSDEDDVPDTGVEDRVRSQAECLHVEIASELSRPSTERLKDGIRVVIAGPPNAGKSTLLNALVQREAAIVSDIAGTTRDRIDAPASIGGVAFLFTDTAGLRTDTDDAIERIGIDRAQEVIAAADLILWLGDPADAPRADAVRIAARSDVTTRATGCDLAVSVRTGEGMDALFTLLLQRASALLPQEGEYALGQRQRAGVGELVAALAPIPREPDMLLVAENLRQARAALDRLTGRAGTEDMLDALFGQFCIGK